jgi:hypothetical protein
MKEIYVDNNATTKVDEAVFEEMRPYFCELYGNPSSMHFFGGQVQKKVDGRETASPRSSALLLKRSSLPLAAPRATTQPSAPHSRSFRSGATSSRRESNTPPFSPYAATSPSAVTA